MTIATFLLFSAGCAAIVLLWNRSFRPVPIRLTLFFFAAVAAYQAPTLFTSRVDVPANLAFRAQPWMSLSGKPANANTGIVFTQLVPWTEAARRSLRHGEFPLWNRDSAAGSPLFGNQQTALLHPFTLLGLLLPVGKAFTLTASLRLFALLFFTFAFLRGWNLDPLAATCGAFFYTFCTFHIVWLLFPLGLATMMLPVALVGVNELAERQSFSAFLLLVLGLAASILGGHPESALWVGLTTGAYALYVVWLRRRPRLLLNYFAAAAVAVALTAVFWLPTVALLPSTSRFALKEALKGPHRYSLEWFKPLLMPNSLGTPMHGDYHAPRPPNPGILDDYGEIASGYAGALPLVLSVAALCVFRRHPSPFFFGAMVFALLTITEAPGWIDLIHYVPLAGITLLQRLRFMWALGVSVTATVALDRVVRFRAGRAVAIIAAAATVIELLVTTHGYNPPARMRDIYPETGAIAFLRSHAGPHRFVAAGWSFIAETPSFYDIEDVKTTDPMANRHVLRFINGYLGVRPGDYDQLVRDFDQPFFNFLGIRYVYVPPDTTAPSQRFREVYTGRDGRVFENPDALPRYFFASNAVVEPDFGVAVARSKQIGDFRRTAIVDASSSTNTPLLGQGTVALREYSSNGASLDVQANGECLLVTSEPAWAGWRTTWNGKSLPIRTVNGAFVGAFVPKGRGVLRLFYRPRSFEIGAAISLLTMLCLVAVPWRRATKAPR